MIDAIDGCFVTRRPGGQSALKGWGEDKEEGWEAR